MAEKEQDTKQSVSFKQGVSCMGLAIALLIHTPIWYWLIYQILVRVDATPTMWVFYWIYLPVGLVMAFLRVITDGLLADKK